jgi:pimeloyl-ACP methyl ester carboxylesterase
MAAPDNVRNGPRIEVQGGLEIATYCLGGEGPPLMLLHATGFHGRCWDPMGPSLTPSFTVWAIDQRGHGASGKTAPGGLSDWSLFVDDLLTVIDEIGGDDWYGFGHSLGGTVLLQGEARRAGTFRALCCYEPAMFVPSVSGIAGDATSVPMGDAARKRRAVFNSRQEALENYRSKPPFDSFHPDALVAYVEHGLVDEPDGSVTLACRREDEASVFEGAPRSGAFEALAEVGVPVRVLGGSDSSHPLQRVAELIAPHLARGSYTPMEGLDHFGPMTAPGEVGDEAARALSEQTDASPSRVPPSR